MTKNITCYSIGMQSIMFILMEGKDVKGIGKYSRCEWV